MSSAAKAISKRLKNNGLQRLRWYCEMCKKQCRDENGFKNHCASDGHLREMEKFSSDAKTYVEKFSKDFETSYLDVLSHNHHTKRVNANYVYNELIQDRNHVHMNATRWDSLAAFVKHLAATGKCQVDEVEGAWFVRWIDPEEKKREASRRKRDEDDARQQERRTTNILKRQKEMGTAAGNEESKEAQENGQDVDDRPIESSMVLDGTTSTRLKSALGPSSLFTTTQTTLKAEEEEDERRDGERIDEEDAPSWLLPEIVVRINSSKAGPGLKDEKAVVLDVNNDHADLILLRTGQDVLKVPSKRLESVIPRVGGRVMVLGLHALRGLTGTIEGINVSESKANVKLEDSGTLRTFDFEDISKVFDEASAEAT